MKKPSFFERISETIKMRDFNPSSSGSDDLDPDGYPMTDSDDASGFAMPSSNDSALGGDIGELSVDLVDQGDAFVILAFIAGVSKKDLDIELARQSIYIRGERTMPRDVTPVQTFIQELYWGQFERTIELPDEVDIDRAYASEEFGLLCLYLPKVDKHRKATVKVRRGNED